jgi:membrane protein implicated in regulation of membrane protease activity
MRTSTRYLVFQLPGWALAGAVLAGLHGYGAISGGVAAGLFGVWLAKDLALYPLLRRAYDPAPSRMVGAERLLGAEGTVEHEDGRHGWVRVRGELWRAGVEPDGAPLARGERVRVLDVRGLELVVERVAS